VQGRGREAFLTEKKRLKPNMRHRDTTTPTYGKKRRRDLNLGGKGSGFKATFLLFVKRSAGVSTLPVD